MLKESRGNTELTTYIIEARMYSALNFAMINSTISTEYKHTDGRRA